MFRGAGQRKIVSAIGLATFSIIALATTGLIIFAANRSSVKHQVRQLLRARECQGCNLSGVNLSAVFPEGVNLEKANLKDANLWRSHLVNANLKQANLQGANLRNALLLDTNLAGAKLQGAIMPDTKSGFPTPQYYHCSLCSAIARFWQGRRIYKGDS